MIVDINMDHVPEDLFDNEKMLNGFLSSAPRGYGEIAYVGATEKGARQLILEKPKGYQNLNYVEGDYTLEMKLQAMDECGVDIGIIRVPVWQEWLDLETSRAVNDNAADMCRRSNGRLFANACVPPWGGRENIYELERCIKELGMVGVQMACHYGQLYLDDEAFKPYLKVINDMQVPVYVRHTPLPVHWQSIHEYTNLRRSLGRIIDQSTAVGRELFSGMFEEFPNLKFIHTMMGGSWFANYTLLTPKQGKKAEAMHRLDMGEGDRIRGYLRHNLYFEATHPHTWGRDQIESAIKICGADHVLFGSSFPVFYNWMSDGVEFIQSLDISEPDRNLVLGGNAVRLFNLPV